MIATLMAMPSCTAVASSHIVIWNPPSPTTAQTSASGRARLAPIAAGTQGPDERDMDTDVLVDLGRVDLDVDLFRVRRVRGELAGDAIVEAHAAGDEQVRLLDGDVHPGLAVHPHHPQIERMR